MLFYILLALFIALFIFVNKKFRNISFGFLVFLLIFIGFFRGEKVGLDIYGYTLNIVHMTSNESSWNNYTDFEIGYNYFLWFLKNWISDDPMIILGFSHIIYMIGAAFIISKTTRNKTLTLLFFVLLGYYTFSFNIMRQTMALGLSFFVFYYFLIKTQKYLYYVITILLIAFLFHTVLIAFLLLPLFYIYMPNKMVIILILMISFLIFITKTIFPILNTLNIGFLGDKFQIYLNSDTESEVSIVSNLLHTAFCIYVIIVSPSTKNIYLFGYALGVILLNILGSINPLFIRVAQSLMFFQIICFSNLWYDIPQQTTKYIYRFAVIAYSSFLFLNILSKNYGYIVPYYNRLF